MQYLTTSSDGALTCDMCLSGRLVEEPMDSCHQRGLSIVSIRTPLLELFRPQNLDIHICSVVSSRIDPLPEGCLGSFVY